MKPKTILIAILMVVAFTIIGGASQNQIPKESKEQPTKIKLAADSVDDKWGEVAFDHTNHATKNYTIDGKGVGTCVECHHTDQPKENLKAPLVTSERNVALTADVLKDAAATPVKTCRQCHLQAGDDSKPLPVIKKDDKDLKVDNEVAYHTNCFACHDAALKARPDLATKISGSDPKGCVKCHVAK
jgi:nitrate reductase cytochrome c-type subunit